MRVANIVLAAGLSKRMKTPKMLLPWEDTTVLGQVLTTILSSGGQDILVVTGGARTDVQEVLKKFEVTEVFNPEFENGEMITSIQVGIKHLRENCEAFFVILGDQPQIKPDIFLQILEEYRKSNSLIIVPSYDNHRGHPWLVDISLANAILQMRPPQTLREFLHNNSAHIKYINAENDSILQDMDSPEEYENLRRKSR